MPSNYQDDTSYKYGRNQKELLGKILSGTLDEDLHIDNLSMNSLPPTNWANNPVFKGTCFAGKHKLWVGIDWTANSTSFIGQNTFHSLFTSIKNVTHLYFGIKYSGSAESVAIGLTGFCRYAPDLVLVEIRTGNDKTKLDGFLTGFMDTPNLKTVILRSKYIATGSNYFINNSSVDTLVFDSPSIATLSNADGMKNAVFKSGGTGGMIYIPKSLYDHLGDGTEFDYKAATNWSTIDGYGTITWAQIEGSEYELT